MGKYINSIYIYEMNMGKIDFIIKSIGWYYAISTYPKTLTFSHRDLTETPINKQ